jgi:hypothetical protein
MGGSTRRSTREVAALTLGIPVIALPIVLLRDAARDR